MRLFDDIIRDDEGPALHAEPSFAYLNRSARSECDRIREMLEAWFLRYPSQEQADLRGRFRSDNNWHHHSAFFELCLHELLLRMSCRVEIHPSAGNSATKRPDFLVESKYGSHFYTEAVLATAEAARDTAARARMNAVYDALNRLDSPNFFVGMDLRGAPETPPRARKIRAFLKGHLDKLDPDNIVALWKSGGIDAVPHWHYEHEGWEIDFYPIPKSPNLRGRKGIRPLGVWSHEGQFVNSSAPIRDAIINKAGRYGDLDLPYVIAVNALDRNIVHQIDIMEALFGKEQWTATWEQSGLSETEMTRIPNGVWTSKSGPTYTRVSAVLVTIQLLPWTVASADICLYHNPWAEKLYSSELTRLPQAIPQGDHMERQDGESLAAVLQLPLRWPFH
jgi:hypothetical protein